MSINTETGIRSLADPDPFEQSVNVADLTIPTGVFRIELLKRRHGLSLF